MVDVDNSSVQADSQPTDPLAVLKGACFSRKKYGKEWREGREGRTGERKGRETDG